MNPLNYLGGTDRETFLLWERVLEMTLCQQERGK